MKKSGKQKIFVVALLAGVLIFTECALRVYLSLKQSASFLDPARIILKAYPPLAPLYDAALDPHRFQVLLLGASALRKEFGAVAETTASELRARGISNVEIHNVSQFAQTSRDSWFKYEALGKRHFDAVVVYHGINELRANNCPPQLFRNDYSHYGWYELWNVFDRHRESIRISVIPYCIDYAVHRLRQVLRPRRYVPEHQPAPEWVAYGADVKTGRSFESNLRLILNEARRRGETAVLMTYAYYVPPRYSRDAFSRGELDYASPRLPIELWGAPSNIVAGLEIHNAIIRALAREYPAARFIDMASYMPKEGRYFDDICHFSEAGSRRFAGRLADELEVLCKERSLRPRSKVP